jgi:integrase
LEKVRDTFVFACYTGPRFSNLSTLGPESGTTADTLEYVQVKGRRNKRKVRVSLPPVAQAIWERYDGRLPVSCLQDFNRDIKKVAKLASLDRPIMKVSYKGTERHEKRGPLHEFITSHVARHTYATLLLDGGADLGTVQLSLGHQNIQVTRRYAKTREVARATQTLSAFENLAASHTQAESVRSSVQAEAIRGKK